MLLEAGKCVLYRRLKDVAAQIGELGPDRWRVTLTAMQPGGWVPDESLPILDLGTFVTSEEACDAADVILESWSWDRPPGRAGRSNVPIELVGCRSMPAMRRIPGRTPSACR